ncbi:MAG: HD domain-containing protein [Thermoproteota archaeon]|nr:HD domain-containing protein [Thermoproteota archaeon]MEE3213688.1 HD domain-containing protein [Thermoproteota archaeon]
MKKNFLEITDPIHDFIRINKTERKIIDTSVFQRLRRIKQLSGAHLTYPGAQHTRFEHSLGVLHIASMAGESLHSKELMSNEDVQNIRFAALLHDIGHGPFSHLFEEVLQRKKQNHEEIGKQIILKSEIGDIISKSGYDKKLIHNLAVGQSKMQYLNEIVSGALSADMMDYLLRDGYFTGAEHAKIDHHRLTHSLDVYKNKLALDSSALVNFETMMISRFQMFKAVYFHKTVRAGEVMMLEAMSLAGNELGLSSLKIDEYVKLTDEVVLEKLMSLPETNSDLKTAKKIATDYQDRKLFKCVFERLLTGKSLSKKRQDELRQKIAKKSKISPNQIFIDTSTTSSIPLTPSKKESKSIILTRKESKKTIAREIPISEIPLVSSMSKIMNILRVYTPASHRKKVEIATKSIQGELK